MTWKDKALAAINPVVAKHREACLNGQMTRIELRRELCKVYPFRQRTNHPYKVWCAMVKEAIEDTFEVEQVEINTLPLFGEKADGFDEEGYSHSL